MLPDLPVQLRPVRGVDLFAGVGGLDLPARALGIHVTGIEKSPDACATRRAAGLATIEDDVRRYGPGGEPAETPLGFIYCACQIGQGAAPENCACGTGQD
ncbi:hypothetical protein [Kitasatospora sp. NPDC096204]|uniref:hypothetical protein n=1 Tax=Kitasatospora sp. NPDC096204 TaxID=3364094 RepID=UPI0037FB5B5E